MENMDWMKIQGWLTQQEGLKLQELCRDKIVTEVGSYKGRSTVCIASVAKLVFSIDTHRALGDGQTQNDALTTWREFRHNTGGYNVIPFCGKLADWSDSLPKVDIVFIDGDHTIAGVKGDIKLLQNKAKLFIFHDYVGFPAVQIVVDMFIDIQGRCGSLAWGTLKEVKI
jgi:hypothetical protein